jgi:hypothetical protein
MFWLTSRLPTTVTGSWPRPRWFDKSLWRRRLSDAMMDIDYREKFLDAVATVLSDQEQAGLNILINGDYHLDESRQEKGNPMQGTNILWAFGVSLSLLGLAVQAHAQSQSPMAKPATQLS